MLSDPISQSEKESVRDSTSLTLVYQIFSFWWGKKTLSLFRVLEIQYCLLSHGTDILGSRVYSLLRYMVLCERWVSSMFFYSPARKWESKGDLFPHPFPHFFWFILQLQKSLSLGGCRCPRSFQHSIQAFQWIEVDLKEAEVEESSCRWIAYYFYWFKMSHQSGHSISFVLIALDLRSDQFFPWVSDAGWWLV